jgi:uncharacterized protein (DUF58 family)
MLDVLKRNIIPITALLLSVLFVGMGVAFSLVWLWLLIVTFPLLALGIYDYSFRPAVNLEVERAAKQPAATN